MNTAFKSVAFHKVSLQYVIYMFLDGPKQGLYACMTQYEIKKISKHDYLPSYCSIDICLIASFMLTSIADTIIIVSFQSDPHLI